MIIKGGAAGNVGYWSTHLLRDDTNAIAEVKEIRGLVADNLPDALKEMWAISKGSRSKGSFMYQANINPRDNEHLTPEQWKIAVDTLEKNLKLTGYQRVVVEHVKEGRQHYHIVWNRVNVDTMRVADIKGNYAAHNRTARELELTFGLERTADPRHLLSHKPPLELWEKRQAERSKIDPLELKAELTRMWVASDSGRAFKTAIEEKGYILAQGDRRDYCVVDPAAQAHSLARRLDGVTAAQVREKMGDVIRSSLPTVAEAQAIQREKLNNKPVNQLFRAGYQIQAKVEPKINAAAELIKPIVRQSEISITPKAITRPLSVLGKVADMAISILSGPSAPPRPGDIQLRSEQLLAQRREAAAWEAVRENIDKGKALTPEMLRQLGRNHLENIAASGDAYIMSVLASMNRAGRDREHDRGRTRER